MASSLESRASQAWHPTSSPTGGTGRYYGGRSPGSIEPSRLDSTGPGIRLPQVRLIAKHGSPRLYKKERIGGLIRLRYRRSEDCLGVAPIEGFVAITRTAPRRAESRARLGRFRSTAVTMGETLRLALDSLRAHKLRSFLTLLGVILAVTTLVAVMSVVAGLNFYVAERVANLGANVFVVDRFGIITSEDAWVKAQKRPLLTMDEFMRLRENMRTANAVAAIEGAEMDVRSGNELLENTNVQGVTPNYPEVRNMNLASGRLITEADDAHRSPVCYIGADVARKFFSNVDPIGKTIRVGAHSYEVIGVAAAIGTAFGQSQDNYMLIPLETYYKEWHTQRGSLTLFVQARNAEMMSASEDEARMLLRAARHQIGRAHV